MLTVAPLLTVKTLKFDDGPPPDTVSDDTPVPVIVVGVAVLLRVRALPRVIVQTPPLYPGSVVGIWNVIVFGVFEEFGLLLRFAQPTAQRSVPTAVVSAVLVTT